MIDLSDWFQLGALPADQIQGKFDLLLVGLSYVVATLASYAALNLVGQLRIEQGKQARFYWFAGGAFTMGSGIWSMHFIGMLAFVMPMPMEYEFFWTIASLLMAIFASGFALFLLQNENYSLTQLILGGFIIGLAIATMHYMGMEGMKIHTNIHYTPGLFFLSIFIGIITAEAAIYLALESNKGTKTKQFNLKIISALLMGLAICGMHYTGMAAAVFTPSMSHVMAVSTQAIPTNYLAFFIAGIAFLIISMALIASISNKKMVSAIENEKNFLRAMLDNLEDGIIACDASGRITLLNGRLQKNIHLSHREFFINDLDEFFTLSTPDHQLIKKEHWPLTRALKGQPVHGAELIMEFKNSMVREVIIDEQKIIDSEGQILGAVAVIHDITELKKTEKMKHEFVSIVSHELRTPLTSIKGSLGLLVSGIMGEFPEKAKNLLEIANNNCERLLLLINDILDVDKIEAGKMDFQLDNYDLIPIITEVISANKMYADKYGVSVEFTPPNLPIIAHIDSSRLMQVLANLISNACKFSPKGGQVRLKIEELNSIVRVSVSDSGPGIPQEFQSRMFQKFSQADSSDARGKAGTGLGLNISKSIIEKLHGTLNFTSSPDNGTTFYFELPICYEKTISTENRLSVQKETGKKLLLCEDDLDQAEYLRILLEAAEFSVDVATSVREAKSFLAEKHYQAMLLDLILPDQDGISFIKELRATPNTKDLPIIVISVITEMGKNLLNGDAVLVADWLDKPIDFNKLLGSIHKIKENDKTNLPHILHIEDNEDTQIVVATLLEDEANVLTVNSIQQAKEMLAQQKFDLFILDLMLPDGNGIEILPLLAQYHSPVLVFSDMKFNEDYAKYISQALMKSTSTNEMLLNTIMHLL
ncbi:MHYT domain-containing protein [Legionella fallonii]|uniref:histidine kinase n=1 Tax=Legionella fallonii LLAP-10 TaxID=1212491 RepID=A0A098G381_9GAMM|nr:MHYT domain-containing protein [Legionella fallonii]CEG56918.1 putative sensory box histidine kinase/response regulator [Legionella fallonii LLAP-10]